MGEQLWWIVVEVNHSVPTGRCHSHKQHYIQRFATCSKHHWLWTITSHWYTCTVHQLWTRTSYKVEQLGRQSYQVWKWANNSGGSSVEQYLGNITVVDPPTISYRVAWYGLTILRLLTYFNLTVNDQVPTGISYLLAPTTITVTCHWCNSPALGITSWTLNNKLANWHILRKC